jgi:hypothetical protein
VYKSSSEQNATGIGYQTRWPKELEREINYQTVAERQRGVAPAIAGEGDDSPIGNGKGRLGEGECDRVTT